MNKEENSILVENIALAAKFTTQLESHAEHDGKSVKLWVTLYPKQMCEKDYNVSLEGLRKNAWTQDRMKKLDKFFALLEQAGIKASMHNLSHCDYIAGGARLGDECAYSYEARVMLDIPADGLETKLKTFFTEHPAIAEHLKTTWLNRLDDSLKAIAVTGDLLTPVANIAYKKSAADRVRNQLGPQINPAD